MTGGVFWFPLSLENLHRIRSSKIPQMRVDLLTSDTESEIRCRWKMEGGGGGGLISDRLANDITWAAIAYNNGFCSYGHNAIGSDMMVIVFS